MLCMNCNIDPETTERLDYLGHSMKKWSDRPYNTYTFDSVYNYLDNWFRTSFVIL